MIAGIADRLVSKMLASQVIPEENAEIVAFGIVQGMRTGIEIFIILMTGVVIGQWWQSIVLLLCFIPNRMYAGGYHAKTPIQCMVKSWLLYLGTIVITMYIPVNPILIFVILFLVGFLIWRYAPIQSENKPLLDYEIKRYRMHAKILFVVEGAIAVFSYVMLWKELSVCIVMGTAMAGVTMLLAMVFRDRKSITQSE